jgi:hypothetical protein
MINNKFQAPSEFDIAQAEARLASMRKSRDEAKVKLQDQFETIVENITDRISFDDAVELYDLIEKRLSGRAVVGHRKVRGHPVPDDLKKSLEGSLREGRHTLEQLEKIYGVSISYIAKLKNQLGLTRPRVGGEEAQKVS